jgi:hypothetical protein
MQSGTNATKLPMILTAGIALLSFCATAIAAITGWVPHALGHTGDGPLPAKLEWSRMDAKRPAAAAARRAFFTAPAESVQINATPKITKE